ncbi:MAG: sigma-54-dependent Fis family transcriptional regulator [Deltaproteobacteria bacterium]|nr:sigma-54-dependent Fis family transcriptional regulator [Deltaproteobacteria bacterium]
MSISGNLGRAPQLQLPCSANAADAPSATSEKSRWLDVQLPAKTIPSSLSTAVRALVIDDEKNIRVTLSLCLESIGCQVAAVASGNAAMEALERQTFDLVLLDLRLGDEDGLDLLPRLLAARSGLSVVLMTAYATIDTAVEAMKRGASDCLPKPFTSTQIRNLVDQFERRRSTLHRLADLEQQLKDAAPDADLETRSPKMQALLGMIGPAADAAVPVLLRGENGTGKGVLARWLHAQGPRRDKPFVVVNCPTLSHELLASELFGPTRGAFTGAVRDQPGRVEAAEGGTLFLDEIGEITLDLQAKLLRFLQDKEFERVGETRTRRADVRIVAATNRNLEADVAEGRFREDLLYRLNVLELHLPPLRERPEDIIPLAERFVAFATQTSRKSVRELSPATQEALLSYPWPGNVRELRNAVERAVILWPTRVIEPAALPERIAARATSTPQLGGDCTLDCIEREHIVRVVARTATFEEAARILGIESSTLWRKRKRYEDG